MTFNGRVDWDGDDPRPIQFTWNGKRKVALSLRDKDFEIFVVLRNPNHLIRQLEHVQIWVKQG